MTSPFRTQLTLAICLALSAGSSWADTKKDLVARLVQLQSGDAETMARTIVSKALEPLAQAAAQAMNTVPADKKDAVGKDVQAEFKKTAQEIEPILRERALKIAPTTFGPILEDKLSEDELRQTIAWLESPVAKKYSQLAQPLQAAMIQKLVNETRPSVEPKLQALNQTLKNKFDAASGKATPKK